MSDKSITVAAAGRLGGNAIKRKMGTAYFAEMGRKGGESTKARHGAEHYAKLGRKGGGQTAARVRANPEEWREYGRRGGARVRELIAKGKGLEVTDDR